MKALSHAISVIFGVLCTIAGVLALTYALDGITSLQLYRDNPSGRTLGIIVPGLLCASAWYMALRLLRTPLEEAQAKHPKK